MQLKKFLKSFVIDLLKLWRLMLLPRNIISDGCQTQISPPGSGGKQRNRILHHRLVTNCTREALIDGCDVFIAEDGYPKRNALGRAMKKKLETGESLVCVCVCLSARMLHVLVPQ